MCRDGGMVRSVSERVNPTRSSYTIMPNAYRWARDAPPATRVVDEENARHAGAPDLALDAPCRAERRVESFLKSCRLSPHAAGLANSGVAKLRPGGLAVQIRIGRFGPTRDRREDFTM